MPLARRFALLGRPALRSVGATTYTLAMFSSTRAKMRLAPRERRAKMWDDAFRKWALGTLRILGIDYVSSGRPPAPDRGRLVVANHRSVLDIIVLISIFGGRFLSREDVARWPVLGKLITESGTLFVDRDSRASGATAIRLIRRHLEEGAAVSVFPEGTTFRGDEVRPFHAGAFAAARGLDIDVVPVGFAYPPSVEWSGEPFGQHVVDVTSRPRTHIGVAIGTPFRPTERAAELAKHARSEVQRLVIDARALVGVAHRERAEVEARLGSAARERPART
jgi:1-acyl-sn-glycerol-3-phosphate acyltransferase